MKWRVGEIVNLCQSGEWVYCSAMTLKDIAIFKLKPLVANFPAKLSAVTENNFTSQLLCLVHENNDLFLRYTTVESEAPVVKLLPWFNEHGRVIQAVAFEPSLGGQEQARRLLVLCTDNTLHIVPVMAIVQPDGNQDQQITSYVVPFVGPHECPNPRTCPNNFYRPSVGLERSLKGVGDVPPSTLDELYSTESVDRLLAARDVTSTYFRQEGEEDEQEGQPVTPSEASKMVCPSPTAVIWWQTKRNQDRAIVGYSDGSVCFLSLTPNCPFIANTSLSDSVESFDICRDSTGQTVTLLINTNRETQWKLLLEEEQSKYIFPGDSPSTVADNVRKEQSGDSSKIDQDWQFVVAQPQITVSSHSQSGPSSAMPKLFPYLREIGTRKIGALKQRLSASVRDEPGDQEAEEDEGKKQVDDDGDWDDEPVIGSFVDVLETPSVTPELITSSQGPRIVVKNHNTRNALFALNARQETVSVHNLNMDPEPFYVYCLPENCQDVLVTQNTIYTVFQTSGQRPGRVGTDGVTGDGQGDQDNGEQPMVQACGVVSKTLAIKNKESDQFEDRALVTYFPFHSEKVINIHGQFMGESKAAPPSRDKYSRREMSPGGVKKESERLTVKDYVKQRAQFEGVGNQDDGPATEMINDVRILETSFPRVDFESCFVVTDKNTYAVELNDAPETIFMNFAKQSMWSSCKYFCDIFNVSMAQCIEYVGDELLRQHKVTQALVTYNVAHIPPIKTALKLATYGESNALLHLCAMALKCVYVLKATRPTGPHAKALLEDVSLRTIPTKGTAVEKKTKKSLGGAPEGDLNSGMRCSDFSYDHDEVGMDVQMSFSSQFHLSNLMFLTLCERTLVEKNFHPLWSFVQVNQRFHSSLASTILCQGGLYSTAVLLAKVRGAGLDVFMALVKALRQEIGTDVNYLMYNLSEGRLFRECVTYLSSVAIEFFAAVVAQRERFSVHVVDRLVDLLNPFAPCYRPIVSRLSALRHEHRRQGTEQEDEMFPVYCRGFVEAFLTVLVRSVEMRKETRSNVLNGLKGIKIRFEAHVDPMEGKDRWQRISAGYAHAIRAVNGKAFIWGSNQVPYVVDDSAVAPGIESSSLGSQPKLVKFLSNLSVQVVSVHCGRTHTLLYTNNGLYAMGGNSLGQLGVGLHISQSLHPVLVETLGDKPLDLITVGQYHNAVVADGKLFVWGWGVYGQLGTGGIEDVPVPTVLEFFTGRKIKQVALGHVHSLVLCESKEEGNPMEDLYVFGSNYFGQLGTGQTEEQKGEEKGMSKLLVPVRLDLNERIRCIHTNYFVNFAVTESNELLTWGASPQALRVINQARKRARSQIRSEMAKEKEAQEQLELNKDKENQDDLVGDLENVSLEPIPSPASSKKSDPRPKIEATRKNRRHSLSNLAKLKANRKSPGRTIKRSPSDETLPKRPTEPPPPQSSLKRRSEKSPDVRKVSEGGDSVDSAIVNNEASLKDLDEWVEHLRPTKVDTSNISEQEAILEVSSGLYHFALRTTRGVYTWGKNIEKQLGNDSSRADVLIPTQLESIKGPTSVQCGADFTLVLVQDGDKETLLAFGNNNQGQCGRETGEKSALMGKWVRLKISKRHIRIPDGSACVSAPTEVLFGETGTLERTISPIKALPEFQRKFFCLSRYLREFQGQDQEKGDKEKGNLEGKLSSLSLETCSEEAETPEEEDVESGMEEKEQKERTGPLPLDDPQFIHYCLFLFYGIYDVDTVAAQCAFPEFRIRLKMLQSKFFEAFRIALKEVADQEAVDEGEKQRQSLLLLEFFTKDENLIPMAEEDLKYFIQEIFVHFIDRGWSVDQLEEYFKGQLGLYVVPLAYVLFFDNNNNNNIGKEDLDQEALEADGGGELGGGSGGGSGRQLRDSVLLKYRTFFNHLECAEQKYRVRGAHRIFEKVSVMFNALICQRVVEIFKNVVEEEA